MHRKSEYVVLNFNRYNLDNGANLGLLRATFDAGFIGVADFLLLLRVK